jgi:hypothetical protein
MSLGYGRFHLAVSTRNLIFYRPKGVTGEVEEYVKSCRYVECAGLAFIPASNDGSVNRPGSGQL